MKACLVSCCGLLLSPRLCHSFIPSLRAYQSSKSAAVHVALETIPPWNRQFTVYPRRRIYQRSQRNLGTCCLPGETGQETTSVSRSFRNNDSHGKEKFTSMYRIVRTLLPYQQHVCHTATSEEPTKQTRLLLHRFLVEMQVHPTASQARKACRMGEILVFRHSDNRTSTCADSLDTDNPNRVDKELVINIPDGLSNHDLFIGLPSTLCCPNDIIAIQTRVPDEYYPPSATGYIQPPYDNGADADYNLLPKVVYEDDHLAIVNKPENLTTIGTKRNDLQSILPFLLKPPSEKAAKMYQILKCPRPVHRLDRRTSGLVLVAKTERAMKDLSFSFSKQMVKKSYVALVLDKNGTIVSSENDSRSDSIARTIQEEQGPHSWKVINYPIDGKDAKSEWRLRPLLPNMPSSSESIRTAHVGGSSSTIYMLDVRPSTGRYHQIRRHLSYCLGCAIVGDAKYDGGSTLAKSLRDKGMFLCSNEIQFSFALLPQDKLVDVHGHWNISAKKDDGSIVMRVTIPLPDKFGETMKKAQMSPL